MYLKELRNQASWVQLSYKSYYKNICILPVLDCFIYLCNKKML